LVERVAPYVNSASRPKITTAKLVDLAPTWAEYRGWTVLFDNPSRSFGRGLQVLRTSTAHRRTRLWSDLEFIARLIDDEHPEAPLAWLPSSTFHVTVMDGLSGPHVRQVPPRLSQKLQHSLDLLPGSLENPEDLVLGLMEQIRRLLAAASQRIEFRLRKVTCRGHAILAELEPLDRDVLKFDVLTDERRATIVAMEGVTGLRLATSYQPHVTLGYVANRAAAERLATPIEDLADEHIAAASSIRFSSASLYGFTDMTKFWKYRSTLTKLPLRV